MRIGWRATVAGIALLFLAGQAMTAEAGEIRVLAGAFVRPVFEELGAQFERATGQRIATKWVPGPAVGREVEAGEVFDLAISQADTIDHLVKTGRIDPATRTELVRIGLGLAVRAGAAKPDIASVEALKRTLLNAKSVAINPEAASGAYLAGLLERMGIAAEIKPKLRTPRPNTGGAFGMVARGEADMGIGGSAIVPGTDMVAFPAELQLYQVFVAGIGTGAKEAGAAKALVKFLTSPAAVAVIKAHGMEPGRQ